MLAIFFNVILPAFLVAGAAAVLYRFKQLPLAPFSQITLYLLTPALMFIAVVDPVVPAETAGRIVAASLLAALLLLVVALILSRLLRQDRPTLSAFLLSTLFPNTYMSLSVIFLAFGKPGLDAAAIVFVTQAVLTNSVAIFIAARSQAGAAAALKAMLKLPGIYAIVIGLLIRALGIDLPTTIHEPIRLLSQAAIPVMLIVLGFQLGTGVSLEQPLSLVAVLGLRLGAAGALAWLAATLVGLHGLDLQTVVIVNAMPIAVSTTILAIQFNARPKFVASAVILATLAAIVTLTGVVTVTKGHLG